MTEKSLDNKIENIYRSKDIVSVLDSVYRSLFPPQELFKKSAKIIKEELSEEGINYCLDIGIGRGDFILPLVKELEKEGIKIILHGFDISAEMINKFFNQFKKYNLRYNPLVIIHDGEKGLKGFPQEYYSIVTVNAVLHYIKNWRKLLMDVKEILKKDGIFLITEGTGEFKYMENEFEKEKNLNEFGMFWREYFKERNKLYNWNPEIKVSNMEKPLNFVKNMLKLSERKKFEVFKTVNVSFDEILDWIKIGFISSIGSGLKEKDKLYLSNYMRKWLVKNKIEIEKKIEINIGTKIYLFKKNG